MNLWMIRAGNRNHFKLHGPLTRDQVISQIEKGKIELSDEICGEGGYWFHFHESDELFKHLAISWGQIRKDSADLGATAVITQTREEDTDEITDPALAQIRPQVSGVPSAEPWSDGSEGLPGFLARVPFWFWLAFVLWALSALYGFLGSTK